VEQRAYGIRIALLATEEELADVEARIELALCPDPDHPGPCRNAWQIVTCPIDDLDGDERAAWSHMLDDLVEQRRREQAP
jgi:hypothetical protein